VSEGVKNVKDLCSLRLKKRIGAWTARKEVCLLPELGRRKKHVRWESCKTTAAAEKENTKRGGGGEGNAGCSELRPG